MFLAPGAPQPKAAHMDALVTASQAEMEQFLFGTGSSTPLEDQQNQHDDSTFNLSAAAALLDSALERLLASTTESDQLLVFSEFDGLISGPSSSAKKDDDAQQYFLFDDDGFHNHSCAASTLNGNVDDGGAAFLDELAGMEALLYSPPETAFDLYSSSQHALINIAPVIAAPLNNLDHNTAADDCNNSGWMDGLRLSSSWWSDNFGGNLFDDPNLGADGYYSSSTPDPSNTPDTLSLLNDEDVAANFTDYEVQPEPVVKIQKTKPRSKQNSPAVSRASKSRRTSSSPDPSFSPDLSQCSSPSSSDHSINLKAPRKRSNKISERKRDQNVKASRRYRDKKHTQLDSIQTQHEQLVAEFEALSAKKRDLRLQLDFAVRTLEERLQKRNRRC